MAALFVRERFGRGKCVSGGAADRRPSGLRCDQERSEREGDELTDCQWHEGGFLGEGRAAGSPWGRAAAACAASIIIVQQWRAAGKGGTRAGGASLDSLRDPATDSWLDAASAIVLATSRLHQLADHPAVVVDLDRPAVGRLVGRVERDAQAVIDRRGEVLGVIGGLGGLLGQRIGLADGDCRSEPAAGQESDTGRRPVVAARRWVDLGRAAEVAQDDDQGRVRACRGRKGPGAGPRPRRRAGAAGASSAT